MHTMRNRVSRNQPSFCVLLHEPCNPVTQKPDAGAGLNIHPVICT